MRKSIPRELDSRLHGFAFSPRYLLPPVFGVIALVALTLGFEFSSYKAIPTPLAETYPYEMDKMLRLRYWGGDNFEVSNQLDGPIHYLLLEGVDTPKFGQRYFKQSLTVLRNMTRGKNMRVVFLRPDELKREIGRAYVGDLDIGLELIRRGLGWYDGCKFHDSDEFKKAEMVARKARIGLWAQKNPVRPSEFRRK